MTSLNHLLYLQSGIGKITSNPAGKGVYRSRLMRDKFLLVFILLVFSECLAGQSEMRTTEIAYRPDALYGVYLTHFGDQHVKKIRGRLYKNPYPSVTEHQFFLTRDPLKGVIYTGEDTLHCSDVMYDLSRDKLIVYEALLGGLVELQDEFITRFSLSMQNGDSLHEFIAVDRKMDTAAERGKVYYQVLFRGDSLDLYKRHSKFITEVPQDNTYITRFKKQESLLILKNNNYHRLSRNRDILNLFREEDDDIKRFLIKRYMRSTHFDLRHASDQQVLRMGQYLDKMEGFTDFLNPEL